jgi:hypothetical protein
MQSLDAQALVQESIGEQNQGKTADGRCAENIVEDGPSMQDIEVVRGWRFGQPFLYVLIDGHISETRDHDGGQIHDAGGRGAGARRRYGADGSGPPQRGQNCSFENYLSSCFRIICRIRL